MKKKPSIANSKACKAAGIETIPLQKGEWQLQREGNKLAGKLKKGKTFRVATDISDETALLAATQIASGKTVAAVADEMACSENKLREAIGRKYIHNSKGKEILKGLLLEGAIATGQQAREKMPELSAMNSVVATGILTSKFIELDKHLTGTPQEIDFAELAGLGEELRELRKTINVVDTGVGPVIDV